MGTNLTVDLKCVLLWGEIEIWIEKVKVEALLRNIEKGGFVMIGNELINTKNIVGIFDAATMEERTMRKNGYWKCKEGTYWHRKPEICNHKRKHGTKTNN